MRTIDYDQIQRGLPRGTKYVVVDKGFVRHIVPGADSTDAFPTICHMVGEHQTIWPWNGAKRAHRRLSICKSCLRTLEVRGG
jgi:hypothetical protein